MPDLRPPSTYHGASWCPRDPLFRRINVFPTAHGKYPLDARMRGQAGDKMVVINSTKDFEHVTSETLAVIDCEWS